MIRTGRAAASIDMTPPGPSVAISIAAIMLTAGDHYQGDE
jgi:hypothetical protein